MSATDRPQHGDAAAFCPHACCGAPSMHEAIGMMGDVHYMKLSDGLDLYRPDGTRSKVKWIISCDSCAQRAEMQPLRIPIIGEAVWQEDH